MLTGAEHWLSSLTGNPQAFNPGCWQQCSSVCSWQQGRLHPGAMQACVTLQRAPVPSLGHSVSLLAPAQVSVGPCLPCGLCCQGSANQFTSSMRMSRPQSKFRSASVSSDVKADMWSLQQHRSQQGPSACIWICTFARLAIHPPAPQLMAYRCFQCCCVQHGCMQPSRLQCCLYHDTAAACRARQGGETAYAAAHPQQHTQHFQRTLQVCSSASGTSSSLLWVYTKQQPAATT
jgi:hypothetical protein